MARSAGAGVQLLAKEGDYVTLRLPSGEMRMVPGRVPGHRRHDRQQRPSERQDRQGRPQASPGGAAPDPVRR